ncbi:hypothetical protein Q5424_11020 [Conexibacter sp. JD483]|uniref:hypothetical protein n=1 Tax=unclassified Conexibacter TaxID=2627773 RepID=UPI002723B332|nr:MULTISPECIES: hypothetical protein [unclassified Conexibacter]MDO8184316.1 hypothetical protein [Conexibacter sp. CPCC 205706]MDO8197622.1 hypothetical protein [Conexibacter sp. CPCC 205762]MDR9369615.1 hypothetical protein [Conexibacter sp. JD483]
MRPSRRHVTPALFAAALATGASAIAAAGAGAAGVTVTGDDGAPVAISPGSPPALRNLRPQAVVTPDPGTRYSVAVTGPDGRAAAPAVTCADAAQPATVQVSYRGNGAYGVALTSYAGTDTACAAPLGPATSYPFTIAGRVVLGSAGRFLLRTPGSPTRRALSLPVNADPGSQSREIRFKLNGSVRRGGALKGRSTAAGYANGAAVLRFPGPGTYTVVARDAADGVQTPWSAPVRIRVVAPFDLSSIRYPDRSGPRFRVFAQIREGGDATGVVSVAIAGPRGPFRGLGRARINGDGAFGALFTARTAGVYKLRFTYRGNRLVTPGVVTARFTVGTAIVSG